MPISPPKQCVYHGCRNHAIIGHDYCEEHVRDYKKEYDDRRGTSTERGYDAPWSRFSPVYLRRNPICKYCNKPATTPHHIIPLADGGAKYDEKNLEPVCDQCHNRIHKRFGRRE